MQRMGDSAAFLSAGGYHHHIGLNTWQSKNSPPAPESVHAWHLYPVEVTEDAPLTRDELLDALTAQLIGVGVHYRAVHLHPYYREKYGLTRDEFPARSFDLVHVRAVLMHKLGSDSDKLHDITAILDDAAQRIERL